jgi:FkbM family methyltransferase
VLLPWVVVDVGARWGIADHWSALGSSVMVFGFDPDAAECARLNASPRSPDGPQIEYVPVALGERVGEETLHVTVEPACSSLYPPDATLIRSLPVLRVMAPVGTARVPVTTLSAWCAARGIGRVDVIKLDTQGSDLDVLRGAEALLPTVQLIEVEVEFNPLYEGQPLFGDVDAYLRRHGFRLWRLDHLVHYSTGEHAVRVRTRAYHDSIATETESPGGQLFWGHAYYTRSEWCPGSGVTGDVEHRRGVAALASCMGLTDLAALLEADPSVAG